MKHFVAAVMLFQVCGNDLVVIQDNKPSLSCNTVTQLCKEIDMVKLLLIRQTSRCTKLQGFSVTE